MNIPWGAGVPIPGTPFRTAVSAEATGGRLTVLAVDMPVGETVPPHAHDLEDQLIIVISGVVGATIGDDSVELSEGAIAVIPRGALHAQSNAGTEVARVLEIYTPSGFE